MAETPATKVTVVRARLSKVQVRAFLTLVAIMVVFTLFNVLLTQWQVSRGQHALCPLLDIQHQAYVSAPPTTETGKIMAQSVDAYRHAHC